MKRLPHRNRALLSALCLLAALPAGCKKKEEAPAAPPKPAVQRPAPAPQAAVQKPVSSASAAKGGGQFDFKNRRDPFKAALEAQAPKAAEPQAAPRPRGDELPIQSYEVSKFKVSGIIAGIKENRALLVDPQGKPYVVQEGMVVGNHEGRITKITANSVEVVERFRDEAGRLKKRTIVLTLAKKR